MIKFQRKRLPIWFFICDDVPDNFTEYPLMEFESRYELIEWLKSVFGSGDTYQITDDDFILRYGVTCGWIVNNDGVNK